MFVVTVLFTIDAPQIDAFQRAMVANARASRTLEPGCRQFDVTVDPGDPATIFLYELYGDRAAFDAHLASAHFREFNAMTANWIVRKDVRTFERIDP